MLAADTDCMGYHARGVVAVCAWDAEVWYDPIYPDWHRDHAEVLERLGVVVRKAGDRWIAEWTEDQAKAFQLLHVFMHELGHHHDRMTTASRRVARGESYAEQFALEWEDRLWDDYCRVFPM